MSNSYKKNPGMGMCSNAGQKQYRTQENQAKRSKVKQVLKTGQYNLLPHEKEYGNEWTSPRDGKQWCLNPLKEWMRK